MSKKIKSLLIANRGEIAVRIAKTCQKLGVKVFALKSKMDPTPLVGDFADEVLELHGDTLAETYLNQKQILELLQKNNVDAVHPGYGFLSENAEFAKACAAAGVIFVGPKPEAIAAMGSKARARELMQKAGVPVVPGYQGEDQSEATLLSEAKKIGLPLLVKASAGGGGKGMRIVKDWGALSEAIAGAKSEAKKSFGDDNLILEKYIENPRHIEFQIFGDASGALVHLGERECSIQRRYQKVIEETPSPALDDTLRAKMAAAAIQCGKALAYENAGTVEFILDARGGFYFLEVNTRLQVEHPITEMCTGLDLVDWQIQVAEGLPLPLQQNEISFSGHAVECRVYAEDPVSGFLPSIGQVVGYEEPASVRVDSALKKDLAITTDFDPMISKVVCFADTRAEAISQMVTALQSYPILGVKTNQAFLIAVLQHKNFQSGDVSTHFIADHFPEWQDEPSEELWQLACDTWQTRNVKALAASQGQVHNVWDHLKGFRIT